MAPWASYLIEGDHDTSAALRDISRTALMPSIVASAKRQVEPFQRFCGVRPVESQV